MKCSIAPAKNVALENNSTARKGNRKMIGIFVQDESTENLLLQAAFSTSDHSIHVKATPNCREGKSPCFLKESVDIRRFLR